MSGRTTGPTTTEQFAGGPTPPLPSKLRPPRIRTDALLRDALVDRLTAGTDTPCVVLCAGAGYGKTTLVRQWVEQDQRPVAWLSLDNGDNDPVMLLRYLLRALDDIEALAADDRASLDTADAPTLHRYLAAAVGPHRRPAVVVLDDVHLLARPEAWGVVAEMIDLAPPGWQVVVSGREVPPLELPRRRLEGSVLELGQDDLRFTGAEARTVLAGSRIALDSLAVAELERQTEGWPAGVYLAVLALQDHHDPVGVVDGLRGDHRLLAGYFHDELLRQLPDDVRRFLVQTSVLDRACGPLCDAVTGTTGSGAVLEELAASRNLFIVPLDHDRQWYRYHHLFGELLQSELRLTEPELEPTLRRRAAEWCAANDEPGSAVDQALAVPDLDLATAVVADQLFSCVTTGRYATLERWLEGFPPAELHRRGPLLLANGWLALVNGGEVELRRWLELADQVDESRPSASGDPTAFEVARAMLWTASGTGGVKQLVEYASVVRAAGPDGSPWYGFATLLWAVARWLGGEPDPAELMEEARFAARANPAVHAVATAHLALIRLRGGQVEEGSALADAAVDELRTHGLEDVPLVAVAHAVHAEALALRQRPEESRRAARRSHQLIDVVASVVARAHIHAHLVLATTARLRGDLSEARADLAEAAPLLVLEPDAAVLLGWYDELRDLADDPAVGTSASRAGITDGEYRILQELPTHRSLEEIGDRLYVSRNTVKSHTVSIYRKLGVSSRSAAVERAQELGLLD